MVHNIWAGGNKLIKAPYGKPLRNNTRNTTKNRGIPQAIKSPLFGR